MLLLILNSRVSDQVGAGVQLSGAHFVLAEILGNKEQKSKVNYTNSLMVSIKKLIPKNNAGFKGRQCFDSKVTGSV